MTPAVLCVGAYILDILGRPITALPDTQNSVLIDEIRLTAAGTAGGTSVDLARLGMRTIAAGATGDDTTGEMLRTLLVGHGVDITHLVRKPGPTASTILPIRPDGTRAAFHVRGANAVFSADDVPVRVMDEVGFVHFGGLGALPGFDGDGCVMVLAAAKRAGCVTTADCLGVKRDDTLALLKRYLPYVDVFLPNDEEALRITGAVDAEEAARVFRELGATHVVITLGAEGFLAVTGDEVVRVPAHRVPAVDATGCGDAFSAGVIRGLSLGWSLRRAAELGNAAAALTVQGLGSDAGDLSLDNVLAQLESA